MNKKILFGILLLIFALTRWYVFTHGPQYYSDVTADYERYANMWRYGLTPYREHLYEYPPATIPLLSIPLSLDQAGIGKYYSNYRAQILILDVCFFLYLCFIIQKIPWLKSRWVEALFFYILLTVLAKEFLYEGLDLVFTATATVAFTLLILLKKESKFLGVIIWSFFWLSTAIKFLTLPLVAPLFLLIQGKTIPLRVLYCLIGFMLIWGIPIGLYRSSLQVSFVYNNSRPIKFGAFSAHLIRWIDSFTHTEEQRMVAPDFEYLGPVSTQVTKINKVIFPLGLLGLLALFVGIIHSKIEALPLSLNPQVIKKFLTKISTPQPAHNTAFMLLFYALYIFYLFIFAKTFSQPFHIWYIPVVILFPFHSRKTWYTVIALCILMIAMDLTTWLHIHSSYKVADTVPLNLIRDLFRFIPMFIIPYILLQEMRGNHLFTHKK